MTESLFADMDAPRPPLAERIRPRKLAELVGHPQILGPDGWLTRLAAAGAVPHLLLWGPPGIGKTTLARILADELDATLIATSATDLGAGGVRTIIKEAAQRFQLRGRKTLFFLDELHRFNKAQQDVLLGDLERGTVVFMGATTENPAFALNNALLSRCQLAALSPLNEREIFAVLQRACDHPEGINRTPNEALLTALAHAAEGDARRALGWLEAADRLAGNDPLTHAHIAEVLAGRPLQHDRNGDAHYDVVSAWIKTMRGSDVDAALYWGARLWDAGEDRRFLFRRLIVFAAEDISLADPRALELAVAAASGFERVGEAEGWIPFAQAVAYMAQAPKSKSTYNAFRQARGILKDSGAPPVPKHLRNAPTKLAASLGHGAEYVDPHRRTEGIAPEVRYWPDELAEHKLYQPTHHGDEQQTAERIQRFRAERARRRKEQS